MSKNIKLIIGSTRQNRAGSAVAQWVEKHAQTTGITLEIIDLKELNLPTFDAPVSPAYAPTETEAGKAWATQIVEADGIIFLTPEYNRSIPASLKNAIDYLSSEWKEKPSAIVSYGYIDGGKGATNHLTDILNWLKATAIEPKTSILLTQDMFDETGAFKDIDASFAPYADTLQTALKQLA